jgi:hypothetical protein
VFTTRYASSPYIKQTRFVFIGLIASSLMCVSRTPNITSVTHTTLRIPNTSLLPIVFTSDRRRALVSVVMNFSVP